MIKTKDKIILGVLTVLLIGINGVFITALGSDNSQKYQGTSNLVIRDTLKENLVAQQEQEDENEEDLPITGSALERASAVALQYIGEGTVTDSEIDDEEGYYEIEITLDNGNEVDVHLDESFNVISTEWEDDNSQDED